jgi:hypothetical protein
VHVRRPRFVAGMIAGQTSRARTPDKLKNVRAGEAKKKASPSSDTSRIHQILLGDDELNK